MTLLSLIQTLSNLDRSHTIYAKEPWGLNSEAVACEADAGGRLVPLDLEAAGYRYFLEVDVAQEFEEGWIAHRAASSPTASELCQRLIHYAVYDA